MKKFFLFCLFLAFFILYIVSSKGPTPFDYFTRLSNSFAHGNYFITEKPSWLTELIPAGQNKFYIPYSPGPALVALPFVFLWGAKFQQQILAQLLGSLIVLLFFLISYEIKKDKKTALWASLLVGMGTILWYMSSDGSSWFLGQITAFFFLTLALWESLGKKRLAFIGFFIGISYLSRVHTILALPFFIYLLRDKLKKITNWIYFLIPLFLLFVFNSYYNFIRFGVIWDKGYLLIPGVLKEPWFSQGIINPIYIPRNLKTAFLALPKFKSTMPYILPSWWGLSILITTPAFIFSLWARLKENSVKLAWVSTIFIFLFVLMHGSNGFAQFGYRFAMDFYPFIMFLTIKGVTRTGLKWYHWVFLIASIIVNLWGVLWINKFGWVEF